MKREKTNVYKQGNVENNYKTEHDTDYTKNCKQTFYNTQQNFRANSGGSERYFIFQTLFSLVDEFSSRRSPFLFQLPLYIDDVFPPNKAGFGDYLRIFFPNELEIKETTDKSKYASYLDLRILQWRKASHKTI